MLKPIHMDYVKHKCTTQKFSSEVYILQLSTLYLT